MPLPQEHLPIVLVIVGPALISLPGPLIFGSPGLIIRPEHLSIARPTRGTITHTASSAFLDDFGVGVGSLSMSGHTGYNQPVPGFAGLLALKQIELLFVLYEQQREALAKINLDPDLVKLYYFDTLNLEAFSVYPQEFVVERQKNRALLYLYRFRFAILKDLGASVLGDAIPGLGNALDQRNEIALRTGFASVQSQFQEGLLRVAA